MQSARIRQIAVELDDARAAARLRRRQDARIDRQIVQRRRVDRGTPASPG